MKTTLTKPAIVALVLSFAACGSDGGESSPATDTGAEQTDNGTDTAEPEADAAQPEVDSAQPDGDTAGPEADATGPEADAAPPEADVEPVLECEGAGEVPCEDDMILDLSLHDDKVSTGAITNTQDGDDWVSLVDATAGGFGQESSNPWIYARFTETGLEKVELDDVSALESTDWDLALKRFVIRLNSGVSGPGCVMATGVAGAYADLQDLPGAVELDAEAFYSESCQLATDRFGLGTPAVVMSAWWAYDGCVKTTGQTYLLGVGEDMVKLTVEAYYKTNQEGCNASGAPGSQSAWLRLRWRVM